MLTDCAWCWLMLIYSDWCQFILIESNLCSKKVQPGFLLSERTSGASPVIYIVFYLNSLIISFYLKISFVTILFRCLSVKFLFFSSENIRCHNPSPSQTSFNNCHQRFDLQIASLTHLSNSKFLKLLLGACHQRNI